MKSRFLFFISCLLFNSCGFTQDVIKEARGLEGIVFDFINASSLQDSLKTNSKSEAFLLIVSTDENGMAKSVHLLAENDNRDLGYATLSRINVSTFKNWKGANCKNKTVIIPISVFSASNNPTYVKDFGNFKLFKMGEVGNVIITESLAFGPMKHSH